MQGHISKREGKHGTSWLIKYDAGRDPIDNRKRIQAYETVRGSKREAQARLNEILSELHRGTHVIAKQEITLREAVEDFLSKKSGSGVAHGTIRRYEEWAQSHLLPYPIASRSLKELQTNPTVIEDHYNFLRREGKRQAFRNFKDASTPQPEPTEKHGLSEKSVLHVHRLLSMVFKKAMRANRIFQNPCSQVDAPKAKSHSKEDMTILDKGDLPKLLAAFRNHYPELRGTFRDHALFGVVALAVGTGMRRGELLSLEWSDIDLKKGTITVNKSLELVRLKKRNAAGKKSQQQVKEPKNDHSYRTIGIDPALLAYLKSRWASQAEKALELGHHLPTNALVFPIYPDKFMTHMNLDTVTKTFPKIAARAGFEGMRLHDCRHSHIVHLLIDGAPLKAVSARVGHASAKMTLDTYDHVLPRSEEKLIAISSAIMSDALAL